MAFLIIFSHYFYFYEICNNMLLSASFCVIFESLKVLFFFCLHSKLLLALGYYWSCTENFSSRTLLDGEHRVCMFLHRSMRWWLCDMASWLLVSHSVEKQLPIVSLLEHWIKYAKRWAHAVHLSIKIKSTVSDHIRYSVIDMTYFPSLSYNLHNVHMHHLIIKTSNSEDIY